MTGLHTLFPRSSFVGFDHLFNELEFTAKHAQDHYPPHNIIKNGESEYLIELAVAGFSEDEINIEVKDRTLTVKGEQLHYIIPEQLRPRKIQIGKHEELTHDYNSQLLTETDGNHPSRTTL